MAGPMDIGNVWKIISNNSKGNQMNPAVIGQMAAQASAAPEDDSGIPPFLRAPKGKGDKKNPELPDVPNVPTSGIPPMLDANMPNASPPVPEPPPPQITPVQNQQDTPYTAQPTTSPIGSTPQELQPAQPTLQQSPWMGMNQMAQGALDRYQKAYENFKLPSNTQTMAELKSAENNYVGAQQMRQDELQKLKENLANYANQKQNLNLVPLAALSDAWFGGNLTKAAEGLAPETPAQKIKNMGEMQAKIAQLQGELPKEQLELMKNKLAQMGYMDERALKAEIAKLNSAAKVATPAQGLGMQQARLDLQGKRLNLQTDKEARTTVNNDSMLKTFEPRLEGAAKIHELIQSANEGKVVTNQALLGQLNAEIARLETGAQSPGLHQSEKTELLDRKAELQAFVDSVVGKPSDAVHPEVLQAADKMVNELTGSYMRGIDSRFKVLRSGQTPEQQKITDAKHKALKETYAPRFNGWRGIGPQVGDVEDGHVYVGGDPGKPESWKPQ